MVVTQISELSKSRCKVYIDQEFAFVLYKGELRLYKVAEGKEITQKDYDEALRQIEYHANKIKDKDTFDFKDTAKLYVYAGIVERYAQQQNQEIVPIEYHVIRLGDVAFVTNPFELFLDYGNRMKARSKAQQTFIVQLCCGADGYLPTEKAEKAGHYSAYVSSGKIGHEGGDLLTRETITQINKLF